MTTIIVQIILGALATGAVWLAFRERERTIAARQSMEISRSVLRDCNVLMDAPNTSHHLKSFVSSLATMAISDDFLYKVGTVHDYLKLPSAEVERRRARGAKTPYEQLTQEEREMVQRVLTKLTLASLAYNPQHARAIRYTVEAGMIDTVTDLMINPSAYEADSTKARAQEVAAIRSQVPQIERIMAAEACMA